MLSCFKFFQATDAKLTPVKNLNSEISCHAAELVANATNPYQASLPMMIYAELGYKNQCKLGIKRMIEFLTQLEKSSDSSWQWMQNNSFKAWMWGRILLAAQTIKDADRSEFALSRLRNLLSLPVADDDKQEFTAWAWAYFASYSDKAYQLAKKGMLDNVKELAQQSQDGDLNLNSSSSANEYRGWVMAIQAAARANDLDLYEKIKRYLQIGPAGKVAPIEKVLARQLGKDAPHYLALELAKVRLAAAMMNDQVLFLALEQPVEMAISQAEKNHAKAEFSLAVLENDRAIGLMNECMNYEYSVWLESKEAPSLRVV